MSAVPLSQKTRLRIWAGLSLTASVGGIAYAVVFGSACDGGRGGALAVAIAFGALFTARPVLHDYIEARDEHGKPQFGHLQVDERIGRLRSALSVMIDRQRLEAFYLTLASVSGTIVWGFGDVMASWLGAVPCG